MKITETKLKDVKILESVIFKDHRGSFSEIYSENELKDADIQFNCVQENHSFSKEAGVMRGLHFQKYEAVQAKLVQVLSGVVFDVIVDMRKGSPTYGEWEGFILSEYNCRQLLIPKGYAHGFLTLTPNVNFLYKCDNYYDAKLEGGISFLSPELKIEWPINNEKIIISEKDTKHPTFREFENDNLFIYGEI
ncbi:dTDP-4-dehydrorhamnose 3,5-epimerase [Enterococcus faecalis]|nr:dTDP-4-dehydrorhamnose 3,5-epimerase [Enterococcus faecalis]